MRMSVRNGVDCLAPSAPIWQRNYLNPHLGDANPRNRESPPASRLEIVRVAPSHYDGENLLTSFAELLLLFPFPLILNPKSYSDSKSSE